MIRVAGLYVVGAWLVVQVAETLLPIFDTPSWVLKSLVLLLALGFVPALVLSWIYELTPQGVKREMDVDRSQSVVDQTARKLDVAVIVLLLAVGAMVLFKPGAQPEPVTTASDESATSVDSTAMAPAPTEQAEPAVDPASIAVLPFADLSQAGDQSYFSDGMSEEILNALVKVKGLAVASRTSSFAFKGQEALGIGDIAQTLSVRHVLEGSVRRAGSTLRITAQLIDAQTDRHLWSETYDRPLTADNVFAIQEDIATAIVAALKESLDVAEVGSVSLTQSTANLSAYDLYLRARALFLTRRGLAESEMLLQQALEQDAQFAKAWELRAAASSLMDEYRASDLGAEELDRRSAAYAQRALELDPQSSLALATLANLRSGIARNQRGRADFVSVVADLERAIELDPHNINAMNWLGIAQAGLGDSERALAVFQRCLAVDPVFAPCLENAYDSLWVLGRADEAYAQMLDGLSRGINVDGYMNFPLLARFEQRTAFLLALIHPTWLPQWRRGDDLYEAFRHLDRDHSELRDDLLQFLDGRERTQYIGALLVPLGAFDATPPSWLFWGPEFQRYRQSPQFREFIERSGTLDYWRAKGFPEMCRAVADSFECD